MMTRANPEWSRPYHGVSHYKRPGRWCTVTDRQTFAELSIYEGEGSGFCSRCDESRREHNHWEEFTFADVESARRAGERWVKTGKKPKKQQLSK